jgi:hypothetical protein
VLLALLAQLAHRELLDLKVTRVLSALRVRRVPPVLRAIRVL